MTDPRTLRHWMVAGPEVGRIVNEFETLQAHGQSTEHRHHEQHPGVQTAYLNDVKSLVAVIEEMGNPFLEKSEHLMVLDTRDILDVSVGETVRKAETLGREQYETFIDERLSTPKKPVTDVIPKNKLPLFSHPPAKSSSKQMQVATLKNDCGLFSRLCIACETRYRDLDRMRTRLLHHHCQ